MHNSPNPLPTPATSSARANEHPQITAEPPRNGDELQLLEQGGPITSFPVLPSTPPPRSDMLSPSPPSDITTPLDSRQMFMICLVTFVEPVQFGMIFPFVYFMVRDFFANSPDPFNEKELGYYVGLLASSFCFAQLITCLPWGATSDRIGRRPVILIGLIGNAITCVMFGASTTFTMAITTRLLGGAMNGNVGVIKSMLGEMTDASNRGRAFSYWESAFGLGTIAGPVLGGLLVDPCKQFPALFSMLPPHIFEVFERLPYLFPCVVSSLISIVGALIGYFYLDETAPAIVGPKRRNSIASSTTSGATISSGKSGRRRSVTGGEVGNLIGNHFESQDTILEESDGANVDERTPLLLRQPKQEEEPLIQDTNERTPLLLDIEDDCDEEDLSEQEEEKQLTFWEIINPSVRVSIFSYATWCLVTIIYEEVYALYVAEPLRVGGLQFTSFEIGVIMSLSGLAQFVSQLVFFPIFQRVFGLVGTFRVAAWIMCVFSIALPFTTDYARSIVTSEDGIYTYEQKVKVFTLLFILLCGKTLASVVGYIPVILFVNDSAPSPKCLGTVHGVGQIAASFTRALGPSLGGALWSWSLSNPFPFDFHFTLFLCGALSLVAVYESYVMARVFEGRLR